MKIKYFYVYILFSQKDKKLYAVYAENLKERLGEHFHSRVKAMAQRKPLLLIHYGAFTNKKDSKSREEYLKSGHGRSHLKKALQNRLRELGYRYL